MLPDYGITSKRQWWLWRNDQQEAEGLPTGMRRWLFLMKKNKIDVILQVGAKFPKQVRKIARCCWLRREKRTNDLSAWKTSLSLLGASAVQFAFEWLKIDDKKINWLSKGDDLLGKKQPKKNVVCRFWSLSVVEFCHFYYSLVLRFYDRWII